MKQLNQLILSGIFMCIALTSLGQKDAPVVGNAAQLVDLLNKDYDAVSPNLKDEEFVKDRAQVIDIFKSYLTDKERKSFSEELKDISVAEALDSVSTSYSRYLERKREFDALSRAHQRITITNYSSTTKYGDVVYKADEKSKKALRVYYKKKFFADSLYLGKLETAYSNNSYVQYIIQQFIEKYNAVKNPKKADIYADLALVDNTQKALPFIGGDLSFTTAIDGLSRFLAKRIKEELTTYVIDHIKDWLENPGEESPLVELKVLLPKTVDYLLRFEADQMLNFPDEIKQYIEEDLNDILPNIANLRDTPRMQRLLEMYPEMDFAFEALELIPRIAKIKHPLEYFEVLENSRNIIRWRESGDKARHNVANAIMFTTLLARSFTTNQSGQLELADLEDVDTYLDDTRFFMTYFGFLYQQNIKYYEVNFLVDSKNGLPLRRIMEDGDKDSTVKQYNFLLTSLMFQTMQDFDDKNLAKLREARDNFENLLSEFGLQVDQVNATALQIRKLNKKGEKVPVELASEFIGNVIDLTESFTIGADSIVNYLLGEFEKHNYGLDSVIIDERPGSIKYQVKFENNGLDLERLALEESAKPYIKAARISNEIILDLSEKKFAVAILKALEIASELLPENDFTQIVQLVGAIDKLKEPFEKDNLAFINEVSNKAMKAKKPFSKIDLEQVDLARKFDLLLDEVVVFHKVNYGASSPSQWVTLHSEILAVKTVLQKVNSHLVTDTIAEADINAVVNLGRNKYFGRVLMAYFSDNAIGLLLENNLEEILSDIYITVRGKRERLFTDADIRVFVSSVDNYMSSIVRWSFATSKKQKYRDTMNTYRDALVFNVQKYTLSLPTKFKVNPNSQLFKLVHFVNDMASSENSEDVEKAIEAFALPSGSFAIKRTAKFNAAINSYPGVLLGSQLTRRDYDQKKWVGNPTSSLSVPVGLSMSWGSERMGSLGLYVPIIDVGAITRLHLDDDTSTLVLPDINFKNIVSPGFYIVYGIPRSPLSITHGFQFGPDLRKIDADGNTQRFESWRVGLGLTLDIPLLNLYTRPRFKTTGK